jgi:hypothetical protein
MICSGETGLIKMPMDPFTCSWRAAGFALAIVGGLRPASACTCAEPSPEAAYERASVVFVGTVISIDRSLSQRLGLSSSGDWLIRFAVTRRWKGVPSGSELIRAPLTGEACGYPFREGGTYLVYAVGWLERRTGFCDGTKDISIADEDMRALDALSSAK